MHVGVACKNRTLISRIRAHISADDRLSLVYMDDKLPERCVEQEVDVLFYEVIYATKADCAGWRKVAKLESLDLILVLRVPTPSLQLRALRAGAYEVIPDSSYDLGDDVRRVMQSVRRERQPMHQHEIAVRSYGEAVVSVRGKRVVLTPMEYRVLRVLLEAKGLYVSTDKLIDLAWGGARSGHMEDLYVYISRLREKLEENPSRPELVVSARGMGYAFLGEVSMRREYA